MALPSRRSDGSRPWAGWILLFLAANLFLIQKGNTNPGSRLAALAAMCESRTFRIDPYVQPPLAWTEDWARTPDGHFYSNKAPGPMLLGYPAFWVVDRWVVHGLNDPFSRFLARRSHLPLYNWVLSAILQVFPWAVLVFIIAERRRHEGASPASLHFLVLAMSFGTTASLYMNTFFGHGLAAVCVAACLYALVEDRPFWTGLFFGLACLSDYVAIWLFPALLWGGATLWKSDRKRWTTLLLGLGTISLIWSYYHTACFGAPWRLSLAYQNPVFRDLPAGRSGLWGIFGFVPSMTAMGKLLFGPVRGLLFTQPWTLAAAGIAARGCLANVPRTQANLAVNRVSAAGLLLLLWLNSAFGGWHGGLAVGPRYLSAVLPLFGWTMAEEWERLSLRLRLALAAGLGLSIALFILVASTTIFSPIDAPLWPFLWWAFRSLPPSFTYPRAGILMGAFLVVGIYSWRELNRAHGRSNGRALQ